MLNSKKVFTEFGVIDVRIFIGYINESGTLNLERFEKFMEELASVDTDHFTEQYADLKYFEAKTGRRMNETDKSPVSLLVPL